MEVDDLEKLKQEFLKLTPQERASIARVMLKGVRAKKEERNCAGYSD